MNFLSLLKLILKSHTPHYFESTHLKCDLKGECIPWEMYKNLEVERPYMKTKVYMLLYKKQDHVYE